jgi:membrane protein
MLAGRVLSAREFWSLAKQSFEAWNEDYASSMGAALAYYTAFSLAPVLILVIAVAGIAFGADAARGEIVGQLRGLLGDQGAKATEELLKSASKPGSGAIASAVGVVTLLLGATSVFAELQSDLDRIWRAPAIPHTSGFIALLRARVLSFGMVIAMGFLLLVSLALGAALSAAGKWGAILFPGGAFVLQAVNLVVGFGITVALFATAYRMLPRARIAWSDVWVGAIVTAILFTLGKYLIGVYMGLASVSSGFGAAGSLIAVLVWVYYSAQIFLLGAEFTWVFAHRSGSHVNQPAPESSTRQDPRGSRLRQPTLSGVRPGETGP